MNRSFPPCLSLTSHIPVALATLLLLGAAYSTALADKYPTLYNFTDRSTGGTPYGGLIPDNRGTGTYFMTTSTGGTFGSGTIDQALPPSVTGNLLWTVNELYGFKGTADGGAPTCAPVQDAMGNLFGSTSEGGSSGGGIIYELSPPMGGATAWKFHILHSFEATTSRSPDVNQLIVDMQGNLFGSVNYGGVNSGGFVFELVRPMPPATGWRLVNIHTFSDSSGTGPQGALTPDQNGNLFGVCENGGKYSGGSLYMLTPPGAANASWGFRVLHFFGNEGDGKAPICTLTIDMNGNLFGTTTDTGGATDGTVFRLAPPTAESTTWKETILHHFTGVDGEFPQGGLFLDPNGNLFGTTSNGGPTTSYDGVFFEISPPSDMYPKGTFSIVEALSKSRGGDPVMTPLPDGMGGYLGTTLSGGPSNDGTIFDINPTSGG